MFQNSQAHWKGTGKQGLLSIALLFCMMSALAHELRPAIADVTLQGNRIDITLRLNLEAVISEIGSEHKDSDDAPQAQQYNRLRNMEPAMLEAQVLDYLPEFLEQITVTGGSGNRQALSLESLQIPPVADVRIPRDSILTLTARHDEAMDTIAWQWAEEYGALILRSDLIDENGEPISEPFSQFVQAGQVSDSIALGVGMPQSAGSTFVDYILIGFTHILPKGLDHILFVAGLFLLSPKLRPIVWQVSMFTAAHTLTLALGITGIVTLPASIVEPLIALSITVICIENLLAGSFRPSRLVVVFLFGLLHGLGFAGVLSDIGLNSQRFFSSLIAFNIGVELGQLAVVLMCYALAGWWFGNESWYRKLITIPCSSAIGAIGLLWFVQRLPQMN